jgi:hypothetical protein
MKWVRRKPAAAALVAVTALAAGALLGVIIGFTIELRAALTTTEKQRDIAKDLQQQAENGRPLLGIPCFPRCGERVEIAAHAPFGCCPLD